MSPFRLHTNNLVTGGIQEDIDNGILEECKAALAFQCLLGLPMVGELVRLGTGGLHRRSSPSVEHAELDHRLVDQVCHLTTQRIHFTDQVALGQAADSRIAGESSNRIQTLGDQNCRVPEPGKGQGGLYAGMPGSNDYRIVIHIIYLHRIH